MSALDEARLAFEALADPTRLRIWLLVRRMELSVGELAAVMGQSQPRVSRHVRILEAAALVQRKREGAWVFVARGRAEPGALLDAVSATSPDPLAAEADRLEQVRAQRARALEAWFDAHAPEWDGLRRLSGEADDRAEQALAVAILAASPASLLDIGMGTGRLLARVGAAIPRAAGIDRSPEMLRLARAQLDRAGLGGVELRQAQLQQLPFAEHAFGAVVLSHVLHYLDDPAGAIAEAGRVLAPGGTLFLLDYEAHGQDELRQRWRHVRLGFEPVQLLGWMAAAGLRPAAVKSFRGPGLTVLLASGGRP